MYTLYNTSIKIDFRTKSTQQTTKNQIFVNRLRLLENATEIKLSAF